MIMDFGRSAFTRKFWFFKVPPPRSADTLAAIPAARVLRGLYAAIKRITTVKWFFAQPGAKKFPALTCWDSSDWSDMYEKAEVQWGEIPRVMKGLAFQGQPPPEYLPQWSDGRAPAGATGQHYCGTIPDFQAPKVWSPDLPSLARGPDGFPLCCNRRLSVARGLIGAAAAPSGRLLLGTPGDVDSSLQLTGLPASGSVALTSLRVGSVLLVPGLPSGGLLLGSEPVEHGTLGLGPGRGSFPLSLALGSVSPGGALELGEAGLPGGALELGEAGLPGGALELGEAGLPGGVLLLGTAGASHGALELGEAVLPSGALELSQLQKPSGVLALGKPATYPNCQGGNGVFGLKNNSASPPNYGWETITPFVMCPVGLGAIYRWLVTARYSGGIYDTLVVQLTNSGGGTATCEYAQLGGSTPGMTVTAYLVSGSSAGSCCNFTPPSIRVTYPPGDPHSGDLTLNVSGF
jgi:hypothetical protein